jgi:DUF4097 and DUF4098 domain-containing protein YvlB
LAGPPATDQTVTVQRGARVDLTGCRRAVVRTWEKDEVRVRAAHRRQTQVRISARNLVVVISAGPGPMTGTDFELTVPSWIGLNVEGIECSADVEGLSGSVSISTVEGDVVLRALSGSAQANSVEGNVTVDAGSGAIHAHTVNGDVLVRRTTGDVAAESVDGDIVLDDVRARTVEASTVDGDVRFSGTFDPGGRYSFTTHDGDVWLLLPASTRATLGVRMHGNVQLDSELPLTMTSDGRSGRRSLYTVGGGGAQVEIETFDGAVRIRRP